MELKVINGWLEGATRVDSPNYDDRPDETDISLLVVHGISLPPGEYGGDYIAQLFTNRLDAEAHPYFREIHQLRVSSHLLIRRDGELLQFVPFNKRAWHAGVSRYQGRDRCNDFSIGIELEGSDDEAYEDIQYQVLQQVIAELKNHYPNLGDNDIVGHSHIAPGRKTDPGAAFDWSRIDRAELNPSD